MSDILALSPNACWYMNGLILEVQPELAKAALAISYLDFQGELIALGFRIKPDAMLRETMYIAERNNDIIGGSFVSHKEEGALVRGINSWGATLARDPGIRDVRMDIEAGFPLQYTPTNHGSSEAPGGLLARCREYIAVVEKLVPPHSS